MISIRTKLVFFIFLLIAIVDALSCLLFLIHTKRQQKEVFKKLGASLVTLLAQDNEVKQALSYEQPAFLDIPIKRLKALDREKEIGYLRISNNQTVILEEKTPFLNIQMEELPHRNLFQNQDSPLYNRIITSSGEVLYDFSIPVFEKTFSEEAFATQILGEGKASVETEQHILGFVQIGLSTYKLNEKIYNTIYYVIIPTGLIIIFGGICITFFLRRYIVSPIRQMASVTLDIAKGDLTRTVTIRSNDEIGQLSRNFNEMTKALGKSYAELQHRVRMEELIAAVSTNFINLAPDKIDTGITYTLKLIVEFVGVDRSYVFLYADEEKKTMSNTHEWCAEGIEPQIENRKGLPVDRFPWGIEKLKRLETIHVSRVADLPDDANAEKELQQSQSVQSFVVVPMIYSGVLIGFLGFDSIKAEKTWTEEDIALLKMVGEIFVNALEHKRAQEEIKHHVQRLTILHKIDQAIISSPDLNIILNVFLEQVTIQLGVDATNILILNSQTNKLECTASRGFSTHALSSRHICPEECYAYRSLLERRIVCISNMSTIDAPFVCAKPQEGMNFTTYNAVPLITKGQVKGVMELFHRFKPNMDNEWLAFVEAIGALAAIAIENTSLFEGMQRSHAELAIAYDTTIEGWSRALDLRDKETEGHTLRVTEMTLKLARSFGVKKEELTHIRRGALLHDIGKMGIPDSILLKPDKLTEEEWQIMRKHPEYAHQLLSPITYLHKALDIPYCHHEKWDGSGYPRGLKGEQIPLSARIFAVIDFGMRYTATAPTAQPCQRTKPLNMSRRNLAHISTRT